MAFELVTDAMQNDDGTRMSIELAVHNRALEARFDAETNYRQEMQRRKLLVPIHEVTEIFRRGMNSILQGVKKLPQETGPQCNPQNPFLARTILQAEIDSIIVEAQKALDSM